MVYRERTPLLGAKTEGLYSADSFYRIRQSYLKSLNWKAITLGCLAGLIPLVLWISIFQYPIVPRPEVPPVGNSTDGLLRATPMESPKTSELPNHISLPVLKGIKNSPNWQKISKNRKVPSSNSGRFNNSDYTPTGADDDGGPTEFGPDSYPQPTFKQVGNRTVATYNLIVTHGFRSPDGYPQPAYLVNGQSPGPEIRVPQHSILVVNVTNKLDTPLTFHWHGIHQRKSFLADGAPHVTQDAIPAGGTFTYAMNLWPQVGTFFYHAHTNMDTVWVYGPLIIEDEPESYAKLPAAYQYGKDEDKVFLLNGVYHHGVKEMAAGIIGSPHLYPDYIPATTINGRSMGEWNVSGEVLNAPTAYGYDITTVKKGVRYRFRFINAASDSLLSCNISGHDMTVIEMDGVYTNPLTTDRVVLSGGQRYSVIITMNHEDDNYYIACLPMEMPGPVNGKAVLNYANASHPTKDMLKGHSNGTVKLPMDRWLMDELGPNYSLNQTDVYPLPVGPAAKSYFIDAMKAIWGQKHVYVINGHFYADPEVAYYKQLKAGMNITDEPQVFEVVEGETVQFVFQNRRTGRLCFSHPWHIHGHTFYVVGEGPDRYNETVDGPIIQANLESGQRSSYQLRDTVTVYANQTKGEFTDGSYCGWAAVRFPAHNLGLWLAHCHVTPHLLMGKKFVIYEHSKKDPFLAEMMVTHDYNLPGDVGGW